MRQGDPMFTRLLALLVAVAVQTAAVRSTQIDAAGAKFKYILPEGFHGWACADFGVESAAPLARDADGVYVIEPVTDGIVATSSFPHLAIPPYPSQVMRAVNGSLQQIEIHEFSERWEQTTDDRVSRQCLFFGPNHDASLVPRPPTLKESKLGTTPVLQRFEFDEGSLCDFRDVSRVCLEASDVSKRNIATAIRSTVPQVRMITAKNCDVSGGIVVDYQSHWSTGSTRSVPRRRNAVAQLERHEPGKGTVAMAVWVDFDGGGADEVAARFGRDLADFFRHAAAAACAK